MNDESCSSKKKKKKMNDESLFQTGHYFFFIRLVDSGHKNRLSLFNFNGSIVKFIIGSLFFLNFNGSN